MYLATSNTAKGHHLSPVVSGVIGAACALAAVFIVGVIAFMWRRRRRRRSPVGSGKVEDTKYSPLYQAKPDTARYVGKREGSVINSIRAGVSLQSLRAASSRMQGGGSYMSLPHNVYLPDAEENHDSPAAESSHAGTPGAGSSPVTSTGTRSESEGHVYGVVPQLKIPRIPSRNSTLVRVPENPLESRSGFRNGH